MFVVKRDGQREPVMYDKITLRIERLCDGLSREHVDPAVITQKVAQGVYAGVTTAQLDELAAETAAYLSITHPDYSVLAARIAVSNLHKETPDSFVECMERLGAYVHPKTGRAAPLVRASFLEFCRAHRAELDALVRQERDYQYDYFGFKTLAKSYLLRLHGRVFERP